MARKKLVRLDGPIAGVCAGLADHLDIDPTIIRVLWALSLAFGGMGFLAYLIFAIVVPKQEKTHD